MTHKYTIIGSLIPELIRDELVDCERRIIGYNPRLQVRAGKNQIRFRNAETGRINVMTMGSISEVKLPWQPEMAEDLKNFIKAYCTHEEPLGDHMLYRGFTYSEPLSIRIPEGFEGVEDWEEFPYRVCWKSEKHKAIITYCEGDIHLCVYDKAETYEREVIEADKFYLEH